MALSSLISLSFFLLLASSATAFNITKILGTYPDFSSFNSYLTQTQLATEINKRQTITVLVVANSEVDSLSSQPIDVVKRVLSAHVVLDYFDITKLQEMKKSSLLTTLFQSSGVAMNEQGFINVTKTVSGEIEFGSAVKGAPLTSKLVKMVAAQPYNISVLQISSPIVPTGIENANPNSTASPPHSASPATPPPSEGPAGPVAGSPKASKAPAPTKASPSAPSESPSDSADAPSDNADVPSEADAPDVSDSPLNSPPMGIADEPAGDSDESPAPSPPKTKSSSSARVTLGGFVAIVIVAVSSLVAL